MASPAKITITSGPDRGKVFELIDELVHIGRGTDTQVMLSDPKIAEHQASIVSRGGRYAIYTPLDASVDVDGNTIPAERWVWLPSSARVRVSGRTAFHFTCPPPPSENGNAPPADPGSTAAAVSTAEAPSTPRKRPPHEEDTAPDPTATPRTRVRRRTGDATGRSSAKKPEKSGSSSGRQVARFVVDQGGEALVKLGEDGHLPELVLAEGAARRAAERRNKRESNPAVVYAAVAMSMLMSVGMLLMDFEPSATTAEQRARARIDVRRFYGHPDAEPRPYQRHLREAALAHARGDHGTEHREYRRVLDLLNSDDNNSLTGLTGDPKRDQQLREYVGALLTE